MRLAIAGAGPIGLGSAVLVHTNGHAPIIWSPSGSIDSQRHPEIWATGVLEGVFPLAIATNAAAALADADAIMIAVPANAHRAVIDSIVPHLRSGQIVILWTQSSLSALYLSKQALARRVTVPVAMWSGPLIGGRRTGDRQVTISTIRPSVKVAALPQVAQTQVVECCKQLFGGRFDDFRAIDAVLSNVNPLMHLPQALCNLTRIEKGETWSGMGNTTPTVARLIDALDQERLQVAAAFGARVVTISEHVHHSFPGLPLADMGVQAPLLAQRLQASADGPRNLQTRYIDEDVPYGAVPTEMLARAAGVPTPLHRACIDLFEVLLQRDLRAENGMLAELGMSSRSQSELVRLFSEGCS